MRVTLHRARSCGIERVGGISVDDRAVAAIALAMLGGRG